MVASTTLEACYTQNEAVSHPQPPQASNMSGISPTSEPKIDVARADGEIFDVNSQVIESSWQTVEIHFLTLPTTVLE